jgi:DNA ligase 4
MRYVQHWRKEVGYDLYPVLRLLLPQKDRERAIYGLKEKNIAKMYIKLIPLGPKDPDAVSLLDWKRPSGPNVGYLVRWFQPVDDASCLF